MFACQVPSFKTMLSASLNMTKGVFKPCDAARLEASVEQILRK